MMFVTCKAVPLETQLGLTGLPSRTGSPDKKKRTIFIWFLSSKHFQRFSYLDTYVYQLHQLFFMENDMVFSNKAQNAVMKTFSQAINSCCTNMKVHI